MNSSVKLPIFQNQASSEGSGVIISLQHKVDGHHEINSAGQVLSRLFIYLFFPSWNQSETVYATSIDKLKKQGQRFNSQ